MQATLTAPSFFGTTAFDGRDGDAARSPQASVSVDSRQLLQGQKAVAICHNGAVYRLQATKLGKLILTK